MTPEQQQIAIAEACGAKWKCLYAASHATLTFRGDGDEPNWDWCYKDETNPLANDIPDYLNDLNAMHEVEKVLTEEEAEKYEAFLNDPSAYIEGVGAVEYVFHATAAQRAEAFLKTKGLWK